MKKFLKFFFLGLLIFIIYLLYNTFSFQSKQIYVDKIATISVDNNAVLHLSKAIKIKTVSYENPKDIDTNEFDKFTSFLINTYPLVDSLLHKKTINNYSFLYTWQGSDPSLKPIVLMAHLDVVPVIESNLKDWKQEPFAGIIKEGIIWGRGALDDKIAVIGILEAVESLLKQGFNPQRTIYIALGHDEEIGGLNGVIPIAKYLEDQQISAAFVLDEGSVITQGIIPGIDKDVALIGIAEKGFVSVSLSVDIEGGHSSMPAKETAIDVISTAVSKLKATPFPSKISEPLTEFIEYLGPEMPFTNKLVFANSGIFESVLTSIYEKKASSNAMVRTTTSPTIFNSGIKDNVIPQSASATLNFRILTGESIESVIVHINKTINDPRIKLTQGGFNSEPSKISSTNSLGFNALHKTIVEIYGDVLVSPTLVVGATDSRHFKNVSDNIYRFVPMHINKDNIKSFHGLNERIPVKDFENAVRFYQQLIQNSAKDK